MTWTEEKQFRAKRIEEIAAQFPGAVIERDGDGNAHGFRLNQDEHVHIGYNSWGTKGHRLSISGCWPRSKIPGDNSQFTHRDVDYKSESPAITVDANKGAEQIKRDIERRFLPAYRALLAKCFAARDRHDAYINGCNATAQTIARACGAATRAEGYNSRDVRQTVVDLPGDLSGRFECSNGGASLTVRSLSTERAVELAKLLVRWAGDDASRKEVAP